jgi:ACT domain-containing protein
MVIFHDEMLLVVETNLPPALAEVRALADRQVCDMNLLIARTDQTATASLRRRAGGEKRRTEISVRLS